MLAGAVPRNLQAVSLEGTASTQKEVGTQENSKKSENMEDVQLGSNKKTKLGAEGTTASTTASENATEGSNAGTTAGESTTEGNTAGTTAGENTTEGSTAGTTAGENTTEGSTAEVGESANPSEKLYIDHLEVYQNALGNGGTKELVRHEELDTEFGGLVYMVDYGSTWSSSSFYLAAVTAEDAPEDTKIVMSAYDIEGTETSVAMKASTEKKKYRHKLSGTIFGSGINGTRRGIYKVEVTSGKIVQKYFVIVNRVLELSSLDMCTSEAEESIINEKFEKEITSYTATVPSDVDKIKVKASQQLHSDFSMQINGEFYEKDTEKEITITEKESVVEILLSKKENYNGEEYADKTYVSEGKYSINITKTIPASTEFIVNPENATICVYDVKGNRVYPEEDQKNLFKSVLEGEKYTYLITSYGYKSEKGTFVAAANQQIEVVLESADYKHPFLSNNEWWNYRNSEENNGVTGVSTPENADEVSEKWAVQISGEWSNSFTPPLLLGGALYTAAGKYVYKLDKDTGEILAVSEELKGSMVFALNSLTYAEGMVFAQIGNGQIQALSATTLESVWISEPLGGQTLSPITYKNGYIYTGTWNSETSPGTYFCLSVTDEDPNKKDEIKYCTWKYSHKGGFYWAGSYASDDYVVFGSDDGTQEGNYTDNSILYSVTAKDGILIDKIEGLCGDIRTSIVYNNGYVYAATKGGYLYRVKMNSDGTFGQVVHYKLGGMATASPVVYKNRIYIGVCGNGGQFNADGGHHFAVLNETSTDITLAYKVPIKGYPQAGALLSTAYENVDYNGDGLADGRVYVYFTYNAFPGGIVGFTDTPGQTSVELQTYFEPEGSKQQYCISPICVDSNGTLYYKNDSCYLMAVESNPAYLDDIKIEASGTINWDAEFIRSKSEYKIRVDENTKEITLDLQIPEGRTVTVNGVSYTKPMRLKVESDKLNVDIVVVYENKTKKYKLTVGKADNTATLSNLCISGTNNVNGDIVAINPALSSSIFTYTSDVYDGTKKFLNIYAKPTNEEASMEIKAISGVKKISRANNSAGSDGNTRFSVYFGDNESTAVVDIIVTAIDGVTQQHYQVTLLRVDKYAPNLTDFIVTRENEEKAFITFTSNESGKYYYKIVDLGAEEPSIEENEKEEITLNQGNNRLEIENLGGKGKDIYLYVTDTKGNAAEAPIKIALKPFFTFNGIIRTMPEDAEVLVKNTKGELILPNGKDYSFIDGNTYYVTIKKEGYETAEETILADATRTEYSYELKYLLSSNTYLSGLFVSSSDQFGKGILKLTPLFDKEKESYTAEYGKERKYLNLWLSTEDDAATVSVYAISGVKGSTVNKDETITEEELVEGRHNWKIYFGEDSTVAKIRVQVKAEDGTVKNYFITLSRVDTTAPVLTRVSASRISVKKASVVFKTTEKGTYYYKVVEKGEKEPSIKRKNGTDALKGTVTISLKGLTKGEKTIYIVMVDEHGNESNTIKMEIPDSKSAGVNKQEKLTGKDSSDLSGKTSTDLSGKTPQLKKAISNKDGNKNALKKSVNKDATLETAVSKEVASDERNQKKSSEQEKNESPEWNIEGLNMSEPVNQLAMGIAGMGLLYFVFWQYGCYWSKKRKRKDGRNVA